jgi:hypothetical protein
VSLHELDEYLLSSADVPGGQGMNRYRGGDSILEAVSLQNAEFA